MASAGKRAEIKAYQALRAAGYDIVKVPTPYVILKSSGSGTFIGKYSGSAGVDFVGTEEGGRAIFVECKRTKSDVLNINSAGLKPDQIDFLMRHHKRGALAMVCWNEVFAAIGQIVDLLDRTKRKSIKRSDFLDIALKI